MTCSTYRAEFVIQLEAFIIITPAGMLQQYASCHDLGKFLFKPMYGYVRDYKVASICTLGTHSRRAN
jgi:hypothetical protein